jgi:putative PIN family toxin of toxin-antitoxin system
MRICVDTNLLIAALVKRDGASARAVRAWLDGRIEVVSSEETLREAHAVLGAGWLARVVPRPEIDELLGSLQARSVKVRAPAIAGLLLKDEGDRRLVEAAVAGDAAFIVTTDREFLRQRGYGGTEFVTPDELLRRLPSLF